VEIERIGGRHFFIHLFESFVIEEDVDVFGAADPEMEIAFRAGEHLLFELGTVDNFSAGIALRPKAIGEVLLLRVGADGNFRSTEPSHG
jgi:hypothetical protein